MERSECRFRDAQSSQVTVSLPLSPSAGWIEDQRMRLGHVRRAFVEGSQSRGRVRRTLPDGGALRTPGPRQSSADGLSGDLAFPFPGGDLRYVRRSDHQQRPAPDGVPLPVPLVPGRRAAAQRCPVEPLRTTGRGRPVLRRDRGPGFQPP
ncbi:DUF5959 family protein [Kitasatospora sp. NPDC048545]|uniref:DUF5959 family protein n=1 Tax=Kitasatospora sp. NPDC048545 TaxID=3157208 RepID=UPI0033F4136F